MKKSTKILKEGEQQEPRKFSNEVKKHFLEIVSTYNKYQEAMDRKSDLTQIAETLGGIVEAAQQLAVNEADDWFDKHTVKRNMSELTKLGKEFMVYVQRLNIQVETLKNIPFTGKFGGAVGNFNAHHVAFPKVDWIKTGNEFVEKTKSEISTETDLSFVCSNIVLKTSLISVEERFPPLFLQVRHHIQEVIYCSHSVFVLYQKHH